MPHILGPEITRGKTKIVFEVEGDQNLVGLQERPDVTAGDGARHDVIEGKARAANMTAVNVFSLLAEAGENYVPLAFVGPYDKNTMIAKRCAMIPFEVVARRRLEGSNAPPRLHFLKPGHVFPRLRIEFFLKTSGKKWQNIELPEDDPLAIFTKDGRIALYHPKKPTTPDFHIATIDLPAGVAKEDLEDMARFARRTFFILERAWQLVGKGHQLADFKLEFGRTLDGDLVLADTITPAEWRLDKNFSKEYYRQGGDLDGTLWRFEETARLSANFRVPRQRIILWCGSEKDDISAYQSFLKNYPGVECITEICSMHKEPVRGFQRLIELTHGVPDTVVIAVIGRSNGAGPTLSAQTLAPTITSPAGYKDFPEDVWSSLRTPSGTPVLTVLEPGNAMLAALQILAKTNPILYARLQESLEERLLSIAEI